MAFRFRRVLLASVFVGFWMTSRSSAVDYGVAMDGNWSDAATWTPAGGPPSAADNALIGLSNPLPALPTASVVVDVNPSVASVQIGQGTLDLSGRSLTSGELRLLNSAATITKNGGNLQLGSLLLQSGSTLDIDAADNLTGFVQVSGASELDLNKALTLEGVSIFGGGVVNANNALAVTTGLIEVNSGGDLNAGGALFAASVSLTGGDINLNGNTLTCIGLSLDGSSSAVNKSGGSVQTSSVNLYNGANFTIDTADNLSRGVYINGAGSHFVFNKALSLSGDITIGGFGVLDTYGDVSANTAGIYLSGNFHLHGQTFTVNSLILENTGTIHREGGSIQVGSIRAYNAAVHTIEANESLTGFVIVEDPNTSLTIDRNVSLTGEVFVTNSGHLTTTGTLETSNFRGLQMIGGTFDAGGDVTINAVPHGVGIADGATLNLHGHKLTTGQLSVGFSPLLGGNSAGHIDRGTGGGFSANTLYVSYGSTLSIEPADTLTQLASVDGDNTSLTINKNLTLTDRIVVANGGELNTTATLDISGSHGLQVVDGTANLGADVNVPLGAVGIANGGTVELNGNALTASQLYLGYSTVYVSTSSGTLHRGTGGSIHVGSLFVYNGSTFSVEAADQVNDILAVTGAGSQLDLNKTLALTGPAFVTSGATLHANNNLTVTDFTVSGGSQVTTAGELEVNGFYGLQISNSSFSAGGDIDGHLTVQGVGVVDGGTLALNGHTLTAPRLDLGTSPSFIATSAGSLNHGAGGAIHVASIALHKSSTLTIEPADTVTNSIGVDGAGSKATLNRNLSLSGAVTLTNGGALATNGHNLTVAGALSLSPGTLDRAGGGNIYAGSLSASNAATIDLLAGDTIDSFISLAGNSTVAVQQFMSATTGLTLADNTSSLAIENNSFMVLTFDAGSATDDWAFRWANPDSSTNRIAEILALNVAGKLIWNSIAGLDVAVRDLGDGFTYVMLLMAGDYNHNGGVDGPDYVVWRKGLGTTFTPADYGVWRAHFGQTSGVGSGARANAAVPEPTSLVLLILAAAGWRLRRDRAA